MGLLCVESEAGALARSLIFKQALTLAFFEAVE